MLRHACGYALANKGHDTRAIQGWLGHRSITSKAVYMALAPNRLKDFWRDCMVGTFRDSDAGTRRHARSPLMPTCERRDSVVKRRRDVST
jgi:hypothetical protein